jgi:hypothetical protein
MQADRLLGPEVADVDGMETPLNERIRMPYFCERVTAAMFNNFILRTQKFRAAEHSEQADG